MLFFQALHLLGDTPAAHAWVRFRWPASHVAREEGQRPRTARPGAVFFLVGSRYSSSNGRLIDDGAMFTASALTHAVKWRDLYPELDIWILAPTEVGTSLAPPSPRATEQSEILRAGRTLFSRFDHHEVDEVFENSARLTDSIVQAQLSTAHRMSGSLAALEVYSHHAPEIGFLLDRNQSGSSRLHRRHRLFRDLRTQLADDGFMRSHGCNSGYLMGPELAETLRHPFVGYLTGANFQQFMGNEERWEWARENSPSPGPRNTRSFSRPLRCVGPAGCFRAKPSGYPYTNSGGWGNFSNAGTFTAPKIFCPTSWSDGSGSIPDARCLQILGKTWKTLLSGSIPSGPNDLEGWATLLSDWFCNSGYLAGRAEVERRRTCQAGFLHALRSGEAYYPLGTQAGVGEVRTRSQNLDRTQPWSQYSCTLYRCEASMECGAHSCTANNLQLLTLERSGLGAVTADAFASPWREANYVLSSVLAPRSWPRSVRELRESINFEDSTALPTRPEISTRTGPSPSEVTQTLPPPRRTGPMTPPSTPSASAIRRTR